MRTLLFAAIAAAILVLSSGIPGVLAHSSSAPPDHGEPVGGCPDGFELHDVHPHDDHHGGHKHIGTDADQNGDDHICVKHVGKGNSNHVHIDNNVPLQDD